MRGVKCSICWTGGERLCMRQHRRRRLPLMVVSWGWQPERINLLCPDGGVSRFVLEREWQCAPCPAARCACRGRRTSRSTCLPSVPLVRTERRSRPAVSLPCPCLSGTDRVGRAQGTKPRRRVGHRKGNGTPLCAVACFPAVAGQIGTGYSAGRLRSPVPSRHGPPQRKRPAQCAGTGYSAGLRPMCRQREWATARARGEPPPYPRGSLSAGDTARL